MVLIVFHSYTICLILGCCRPVFGDVFSYTFLSAEHRLFFFLRSPELFQVIAMKKKNSFGLNTAWDMTLQPLPHLVSGEPLICK